MGVWRVHYVPHHSLGDVWHIFCPIFFFIFCSFLFHKISYLSFDQLMSRVPWSAKKTYFLKQKLLKVFLSIFWLNYFDTWINMFTLKSQKIVSMTWLLTNRLKVHSRMSKFFFVLLTELKLLFKVQSIHLADLINETFFIDCCSLQRFGCFIIR